MADKNSDTTTKKLFEIASSIIILISSLIIIVAVILKFSFYFWTLPEWFDSVNARLDRINENIETSIEILDKDITEKIDYIEEKLINKTTE